MSDQPAYQVLARKYRPQTFADLIGQEAMVRTLKNAFAADRIAHAFVMTGVRGVGKTTTARIIAKGLNCVGPDGTGTPTTEPCGVCKPCIGISEGRFFDVLEIDAASSTGVDNIRELNAMANTRPAEGRFKIFIIDEVHMLSINAFNALLKTLEEPRAHTKFIMATTEIRKVPVTVLSRCQRFDLKRIEPEVMMAHLAAVAAKEGASLAPDALALITRAAEGSVRDAMSLMDQAIAHGAGETSAAQVRAMLGLADRGRVLDLFDLVMKGDAAQALAELSAQYADGADPMAVLRDLAEITHWISVIKINPAAAEDPTTPPDEQTRGLDMAARLPMRALSRMWQMLLKSLEEVPLAPNAMMAAEMAIIRLTHVADLPDPETLIRKLQAQPQPPAIGGAPAGGSAGGAVHAPTMRMAPAAPARGPAMQSGQAVALASDPSPHYSSFPQVVDLIREKRDFLLLKQVEDHVRLVQYAPGRIEFEPGSGAPPDLASRLSQRLQGWTGLRWGVSVVSGGGAPSIAEARDETLMAAKAEARRNPLVQAILAAFPGTDVAEVRTPEAMAATAAVEALPEVEDEWDPFEDN
ncbi:MAG: DNA polymerase III subunit gamma/tau [Tabrizicola sp.]|uniref:DNA polymerase III subunit gamma/tau n=1 Tax=Tabrizicola sp. TaxID=2005166 RepID=UPI0027347180|nr:DNA polymerase III subunit gamma/tau [Tabrizicola sp.]MDP3262321.1 DNA polymerase III subunit gamma/tau [Tabrizicola sp.]MDP3647932.1 DNA polymerase III subunit gamma/tau [Paracoccaceae bacterium]MDZ4069944.1 DNA polymerase III subunit gamma/tau [Tabrizicola sp.]